MKNKDITVEVAYICNGKNPSCNNSTGCFYKKTNGIKGPCAHTRDKKYAKYSASDPKKHPERFEKYRNGNIIRYYEKFRTED